MTRENKLALIIGFSLVLIVAILITDHLSPAQSADSARLGVGGNSESSSSRSIFDRLPSGGDDIQLARNTEDENQPPDDVRPVRNENRPDWTNELRRGNAALNATHGNGEIRVPPAESPAAADHLHKVLDDETLYSIAKHYYGDGSLFAELGIYNRDRVGADYTLTKGQLLKIPDRDVLLGRSPGSSPREEQSARANTRFIEHTIVDTDRLWDLAKEYLGSGTKWTVIAELNKDVVPNPDLLPVGKTIRIPLTN